MADNQAGSKPDGKPGLSDWKTKVLKQRKNGFTQAVFWKIEHSTHGIEVKLKLGRYAGPFSRLESANPKSEVTLDGEEFETFMEFVAENYEPFRAGVKNYIPIKGDFDRNSLPALKAVFNNPDKRKLLEYIVKNDIIPNELLLGLQHASKLRAVRRFDELLDRDLEEKDWQDWFKANSWVLGTEFVGILDERKIDTQHIADYLMRAYDGFLDVVEIKKPGPDSKFWSNTLDHDNYVPSQALVRAITQATRYLFEVEREANSVKFADRVKNVRTVKPRCVLIFGRSSDWDQKRREAYRILNASYHNLSILTYDHVLERAKRMTSESDGVLPSDSKTDEVRIEEGEVR